MQAQDTRPATRLTALYEAHAADVFRFAMHLTGSREDAEDVVQFVFLAAYAALEDGTELMHPRAWLMKAAKHRSLNTIRDRREAPMAESELPLSPRHDPDPSEAAALAAVRSTLWTLPEGQHQAFVLRHWSGLSQDEIADVLDTTPGAVESLLIRARRALLEDQQGAGSECSRVRSRLVQALIPSSAQQAHITSCRRCRTAQSRLLRASEFAAAYALVPRPWVEHTLSSAIPGFGSSAAVTTTAAATGGGGAGVTAASAATKAALLAKVTLATATAVVALGATHPVRSALADAIAGRPAPPAHRLATTTHPPAPTTARPLQRAAGGAQAAGASGTAPGKSSTAGSNGNGAARGKSATAGSNGNGAARGKSATAGSNGNGAAHGKSATAGSNGNGAAHGKSATAGSNGKAGGTGKSATAGSNGKAGGTGKSATAGGNGNGMSAGGSGNAGGHDKGKPTS
jgi:RNA polymerase sigma factor (sigma-70 family)